MTTDPEVSISPSCPTPAAAQGTMLQTLRRASLAHVSDLGTSPSSGAVPAYDPVQWIARNRARLHDVGSHLVRWTLPLIVGLYPFVCTSALLLLRCIYLPGTLGVPEGRWARSPSSLSVESVWT
jgi:hypothetical protein